MCLFPMGQGSNCFGETVQPQDQQSAKHKSQLQTIFWFQITIFILDIVLVFQNVFYSFNQIIYDILLILLLHCSYKSLSHNRCVFYTFIAIFQLINCINIIGQQIQNHRDNFFNVPQIQKFGLILVFFSIIFYITAIYFVFQAYKKFKTNSFSGPTYQQQQQFLSQPQQQSNQLPQQDRSQQGFNAFQGKGIQIK